MFSLTLPLRDTPYFLAEFAICGLDFCAGLLRCRHGESRQAQGQRQPAQIDAFLLRFRSSRSTGVGSLLALY